jgi:hypothetical protein
VYLLLFLGGVHFVFVLIFVDVYLMFLIYSFIRVVGHPFNHLLLVRSLACARFFACAKGDAEALSYQDLWIGALWIGSSGSDAAE